MCTKERKRRKRRNKRSWRRGLLKDSLHATVTCKTVYHPLASILRNVVKCHPLIAPTVYWLGDRKRYRCLPLCNIRRFHLLSQAASVAQLVECLPSIYTEHCRLESHQSWDSSFFSLEKKGCLQVYVLVYRPWHKLFSNFWEIWIGLSN